MYSKSCVFFRCSWFRFCSRTRQPKRNREQHHWIYITAIQHINPIISDYCCIFLQLHASYFYFWSTKDQEMWRSWQSEQTDSQDVRFDRVVGQRHNTNPFLTFHILWTVGGWKKQGPHLSHRRDFRACESECVGETETGEKRGRDARGYWVLEPL